MHDQLERHIKPLIDEYPALAGILEEAGIGCAPCSLGTCRVKDILEIHNLDGGAAQDLLRRMGAIIFGDRPFDVPVITRRATPPKAFCPPIARMVEEHTYILRVIGALPALGEALGKDRETALPLARRALAFIRQYADRYHHAKEEDILFGFFDPEADILQVMRQDHVEGRNHVQGASKALEAGDNLAFESHMKAYGELLRGHIQREDQILYPWMDRTLSTRQVGELFSRCQEVELTFAPVRIEMEALVAELEEALRG